MMSIVPGAFVEFIMSLLPIDCALPEIPAATKAGTPLLAMTNLSGKGS
jgi:hypothetical protein